jgi:hypothetical protein
MQPKIKTPNKIEYGFCFRPVHGRSDCSGFLHLFFIDRRDKPCLVPTEYDVKYEEWNPFDGVIVEGASPERRLELMDYGERIARDLLFVERIVQKLEGIGRRYSAADVAKAYRRYKRDEKQASRMLQRTPIYEELSCGA